MRKHFQSAILVRYTAEPRPLYTNNTDRFIGSLTSALLDAEAAVSLANLISLLKTFEQRKVFDAMTAFLVKRYTSADDVQHGDAPIAASKTISGLASLFHTILGSSEALKDHAVSLLTRSAIPSLNDSLSARRSMVAALAEDEG